MFISLSQFPLLWRRKLTIFNPAHKALAGYWVRGQEINARTHHDRMMTVVNFHNTCVGGLMGPPDILRLQILSQAKAVGSSQQPRHIAGSPWLVWLFLEAQCTQTPLQLISITHHLFMRFDLLYEVQIWLKPHFYVHKWHGLWCMFNKVEVEIISSSSSFFILYPTLSCGVRSLKGWKDHIFLLHLWPPSVTITMHPSC